MIHITIIRPTDGEILPKIVKNLSCFIELGRINESLARLAAAPARTSGQEMPKYD
jgi:hypothetical protein